MAALFFLQMCVILASCRVMGWLARRVGQPQVVGEMIAGVLLGPSLFGLLLPALHGRLFPPESLKILQVGAQLGIGLYMFVVGLQTKTEQVKSMPDFKLSEYGMGEMKVALLNKETALVTYPLTLKGTYKGKTVPLKNYASALWVLQGGKWLEAFYQETPLDGK